MNLIQELSRMKDEVIGMKEMRQKSHFTLVKGVGGIKGHTQ